MPAHSSGAACVISSESGIWSTKCSGATIIEYPPLVILPSTGSVDPYVQIVSWKQLFSNPRLHASHSPQLFTIQPTPARSPGLKSVTLLPTRVTTPTISCPGTQG